MKKQLPKNWGFLPFTEIFDINGGTQPPKAVFIDEPKEGYIRLLQIRDFGKKPVPTYIPDTGKLMTCKKDDILIARYGASIGRIVTGMEGSYNVALAKVSVPENMDKNFVKWLLKSNLFQEPILSIQRTAQNGFNKTDLASIYIPLPPLAEQNRIVAKLDTLFTQLETIKASMAKVPLLLKDFRQQVLTQAVTGKLTEEFKYSNILNEIIEDKTNWYNSQLAYSLKNKSKKPRKQVTEFSGDKDYLKKFLVKKIDIAFLDEISAKKENALKAGPFGSSLKKEFYVEKGYKIYGQEQVINDDPFYGNYYVNEEKFKELQSCEVEENDILVSLVGTIGKVLIIPKDYQKGIINPRLVKLSLHEKINPKFVKIFLQSLIVKDFLKENSHGGTMDVLNLGIIKSLPIPIPSHKEQQEIVSRVESLFAKADAIEQQYKLLKEKVDTLPQALLHKAFKGELTEQLDSDGDAKDLLKEIQKLKAGVSKVIKSKSITKNSKSYSENKEVLAMVAEPK
jgi:type I restriction enzyme S subunit